MIDEEWLMSRRFKHVADLILVNGKFHFAFLPGRTNKKSSVYIYEHNGDPLYVGKAGRGFKYRSTQHKPALNQRIKMIIEHNKSQQTPALGTDVNAWYLYNLLNVGEKIRVYERIAETANVLGVKRSLFSTEEEALIETLDPILNNLK